MTSTRTNLLRAVTLKAESLESTTSAVLKVVEQSSLAGLDFHAQQAALEASLTNARAARRTIDAAITAHSATEAAEDEATTLIVSTVGILLAGSSDPRATTPEALAQLSSGELLGIIDEFAGRSAFSSPIVEGMVPLLPAIKSRVIAMQTAANQARIDIQAARHAWAAAVLRLQATLTTVRSDLMAVGIRTRERRPNKPKQATAPPLVTVDAPAANDQAAPAKVG